MIAEKPRITPAFYKQLKHAYGQNSERQPFKPKHQIKKYITYFKISNIPNKYNMLCKMAFC